MSQAAVGQRSAQRPQCRQTFSSLTITRLVCSMFETYKSCEVLRAGHQARRKSSSSAIGRKRDAGSRANVHTGVAFDAAAGIKNGLHIAVQATLRLFETDAQIEAQFNFHFAVGQCQCAFRLAEQRNACR